MMKLRDYQKWASDAAFNWVTSSIDPCLIDAATGAGKSLIISDLASRIHEVSGKRILCTAPSKELVEQNHEKYLATGAKASIFSASIRKDLRYPVVFATPQTVVNSLHRFGDYAAIIADEAHGITPTMTRIIESMRGHNPNIRVVGCTATPYRTGTGYIFRNHYEHGRVPEDQAVDPFFHTLVYSVGARYLIDRGFLTPPIVGGVDEHYDTSGLVMKSNGQWDQSTVDAAFQGRGRLTSQIVADVVARSRDRKGVMFFAATVQHAAEIMESLPPHNARIITGGTNKKERERIIRDFKARRFKYLVNVAVLTTGFDAEHVDVIALLRATESPGLLQQIIGRGTRLCDDKDDFLVLDYAENIERHFPHGDIFEPVIKVRARTEGEGIDATCEICHHVNNFGARPNPEGYPIDKAGYFTDLTGARIETAQGLPMPAHFGRRCEGETLVGGKHQRCHYKWSYKECPECQAENDIAARYCGVCKGELVDPNEKLKELAAKISTDPYRTRTEPVQAMMVQSWPKPGDGPDTIRVTYEIAGMSQTVSEWFSPDSEHSYARKMWADFSVMAFGEVLARDDAVRVQPIIPDLLVFRKERGSKYFKVVNKIWPEQSPVNTLSKQPSSENLNAAGQT